MKENKITDIPVIIITAERTEQNLLKTLPYNIKDFICKPFDVDLIRGRMRTMFHFTW